MLDDFAMPFGGSLNPNNRWVKLSRIMPWDYIEQIYLESMSVETGRRAISSRVAFGSIFIKEYKNLTDEECVAEIQENPYMQYFLGLHGFQQEPLFDSSMMVHFRKRFPAEEVSRINEYVCTGKWPDGERNVDRNDEIDDKDPQDDEDNQDDDSKSPPKSLRGKKNPNTSKKKQKRQKKNKGKLIMDATVADALTFCKVSIIISPVSGFY